MCYTLLACYYRSVFSQVAYVCCRYLFSHWTVEQRKQKGTLAWSSTSHLMLANLLKLDRLDTIHGWGSIRLVNAREKKPAELAISAIPPVYAQLTTRRQGDRVLSISFHLALLGQVRHVTH